MTDRDRELDRLAQADSDITDGEQRVADQTVLVDQLRADGHDTEQAERLLVLLLGALTQWRAHRELIIQAIADLDAGRRPS